ncbi:MAG: hypothetical protein WA373_17540 [Burkholderiales bacterium]
MPDVTISDAGTHLIISGDTRAEVDKALAELQLRGAAKVTAPVLNGTKWVASCEHPTNNASSCIVDQVGFQYLLRGSSKHAVEAKIEELLAQGAHLMEPIEEQNGEWIAVCDASANPKLIHRW